MEALMLKRRIEEGSHFDDDAFYLQYLRYFNIIAQIHSVVETRHGTWIMRVWRGTKFGPEYYPYTSSRAYREQFFFRVTQEYFNKYIVQPDPRIAKAIDVLGKEMLMEIEVYDEHRDMLEALRSGEYVAVTNIHYARSYAGDSLKLHGGTSYNRGILKIPANYPNDELQYLKIRIEEALEQIKDYETFVEFIEQSKTAQMQSATAPILPPVAPSLISLYRKPPPPQEARSWKTFAAASRPGTKSFAQPCTKIIIGDLVAVDWFGKRDAKKYHFLTHAHTDHCRGLDRKWGQKVYCSKKTAMILPQVMGYDSPRSVPPGIIHPLEEDEPNEFDGFTVRLFDANHCPGSVMFVFEGPKIPGGCVLCTGDFRADKKLMRLLEPGQKLHWITEKRFATVYLDNTYFSLNLSFPDRETAGFQLFRAMQPLRGKNIYIPLHRLGREEMIEELSRQMMEPVIAYEEKKQLACSMSYFFEFGIKNVERTIRIVKRNKWQLVEGEDHLDFVIFDVSMLHHLTASDSMIEKHKERVIRIPYSDHSSREEIVAFLKKLRFLSVVPCSKRVTQQDLEMMLACTPDDDATLKACEEKLVIEQIDLEEEMNEKRRQQELEEEEERQLAEEAERRAQKKKADEEKRIREAEEERIAMAQEAEEKRIAEEERRRKVEEEEKRKRAEEEAEMERIVAKTGQLDVEKGQSNSPLDHRHNHMLEMEYENPTPVLASTLEAILESSSASSLQNGLMADDIEEPGPSHEHQEPSNSLDYEMGLNLEMGVYSDLPSTPSPYSSNLHRHHQYGASSASSSSAQYSRNNHHRNHRNGRHDPQHHAMLDPHHLDMDDMTMVVQRAEEQHRNLHMRLNSPEEQQLETLHLPERPVQNGWNHHRPDQNGLVFSPLYHSEVIMDTKKREGGGKPPEVNGIEPQTMPIQSPAQQVAIDNNGMDDMMDLEEDEEDLEDENEFGELIQLDNYVQGNVAGEQRDAMVDEETIPTTTKHPNGSDVNEVDGIIQNLQHDHLPQSHNLPIQEQVTSIHEPLDEDHLLEESELVATTSDTTPLENENSVEMEEVEEEEREVEEEKEGNEAIVAEQEEMMEKVLEEGEPEVMDEDRQEEEKEKEIEEKEQEAGQEKQEEEENDDEQKEEEMEEQEDEPEDPKDQMDIVEKDDEKEDYNDKPDELDYHTNLDPSPTPSPVTPLAPLAPSSISPTSSSTQAPLTPAPNAEAHSPEEQLFYPNVTLRKSRSRSEESVASEKVEEEKDPRKEVEEEDVEEEEKEEERGEDEEEEEEKEEERTIRKKTSEPPESASDAEENEEPTEMVLEEKEKEAEPVEEDGVEEKEEKEVEEEEEAPQLELELDHPVEHLSPERETEPELEPEPELEQEPEPQPEPVLEPEPEPMEVTRTEPEFQIDTEPESEEEDEEEEKEETPEPVKKTKTIIEKETWPEPEVSKKTRRTAPVIEEDEEEIDEVEEDREEEEDVENEEEEEESDADEPTEIERDLDNWRQGPPRSLKEAFARLQNRPSSNRQRQRAQ